VASAVSTAADDAAPAPPPLPLLPLPLQLPLPLTLQLLMKLPMKLPLQLPPASAAACRSALSCAAGENKRGRSTERALTNAKGTVEGARTWYFPG
jgi:hypothetical protein